MTCPICNRPAGSPYRVYDARGKVTTGCVDEYHTGHLVTPSESARWHNRPEAKKIRALMKKGREGKGYGKNPVPPSKVKEAAKLYEEFSGHSAKVVGRLRGKSLPPYLRDGAKVVLIPFGTLDAIEYTTIRDGEREMYRHSFKKSARPLIAVTHDGRHAITLGGDWRFTDAGFEDHK